MSLIQWSIRKREANYIQTTSFSLKRKTSHLAQAIAKYFSALRRKTNFSLFPEGNKCLYLIEWQQLAIFSKSKRSSERFLSWFRSSIFHISNNNRQCIIYKQRMTSWQPCESWPILVCNQKTWNDFITSYIKVKSVFCRTDWKYFLM